MINVVMRGRLGNQLFRYAMIRAYMKKNNITSVCFDFSKVYESNFKNELNSFNIIDYTEKKSKLSLTQYIILSYIRLYEKIINVFLKNKKSVLKNIFEKKIQNSINKYGIIYLNQGYYDFKYYNNNNMFVEGNFESAKYFDEYRDEIIKELTPKHPKLQKNLKLYKIIEESNSICITIRRGDFLNKDNIKAHYVCTPEYFNKAIERIMTLVDNPHFIVFSDDIKWVKENMSFPCGVEYEDGTDPIWEKLRLMYSCKHFIISNSTFSWWAQYLSRNNNKIVIAPNKWKNTYQNEDIYQDNWIRIDP